MGKIMEWFEERPDMMIVVPFVVMLLSLILVASFPKDSIATTIFTLILISSVFVGIPTACAWTLESKNRSLWWLLLLFGFSIIGLIVIIMLEDRSEEVLPCDMEVRPQS
jgi:hypothetical protein